MAIASSGAVSVGSAAGSGRSINVELGRTQNTANSTMTAVVTAATTGTTPRGSGSVTDARPHAFSEWHNYTHAQAMGTISYLLRTGTNSSVYGMRELTDTVDPLPTESNAEGGMFLTRYSPSGGGYTKIFGDVMKESDLTQIDNAEGTINRRYATASSYATMGSFANNTNPTELISIPVEGVTLSVAAELISGEGTGFADNQVTGLATGHTIISGSAKGADDASASGFGTEHISAYWKYTITASLAGYTTTVLTPFVSFSRHQASSEDEGN